MKAGLLADARVRARLRTHGPGRSPLIDFYAARRCTGLLVGDLETRWLRDEAPSGLILIAILEGVPILSDPRLAVILEDGAALVASGPPWARSIGVRLEHPERWLAFLETPAARRRRPSEAARA